MVNYKFFLSFVSLAISLLYIELWNSLYISKMKIHRIPL